jgi:hypothetical protein
MYEKIWCKIQTVEPADKPVNKQLAAHLRRNLLARNGSNSAIGELALRLSDAELIKSYETYNQQKLLKLRSINGVWEAA